MSIRLDSIIDSVMLKRLLNALAWESVSLAGRPQEKVPYCPPDQRFP